MFIYNFTFLILSFKLNILCIIYCVFKQYVYIHIYIILLEECDDKCYIYFEIMSQISTQN